MNGPFQGVKLNNVNRQLGHGLLITIAIYEILLFPALIQYIDWHIQSLFNGEIF